MNWDVPSEVVLSTRPDYELGARGFSTYLAHTDAEFRRMRCTYYGLVSYIDQQVGRIIDCLEMTGRLDNTLILYTSDHGNLMGEYGQFQKGMFYDIVTRVPCILAGPGVPAGERISGFTECVDIAPTVLELAHINVPETMVGQNMFTGRKRDSVIGEIALGRGGKLRRRSWIRTKRWSMDFTSEINSEPTILPDEKDGKLVDLVNDPLEHQNLYYNPIYSRIVEELETKFFSRTMDQRVPVQTGKKPFSQVT
jgi:arylsulfatase A-like enzyme